MSVDAHPKHSLHPIRKRILGLILRFVLLVLFLEFVVYFGSNIFFAEYARRKVNEATEGVYVVEFNRINFSLIRRGIFLNGLVMKPIHPEDRKDGQSLFDFTLDEVGFSSLWYDFSQEHIIIGSIYIDNPNFLLDAEDEKVEKIEPAVSQNGFVSPVKLLEEEIRKSLGRIPFLKLFIHEIEINHANGFFLKFLSKNNLEAQNTSVVVRDVDWTVNSDWKTPFNANGFEFNLEQINYPLPDGVHIIKAGTVLISSSDKIIDVREFSLSADTTLISRAYYEAYLDKLLMGNIDLHQVFMTSNLEVDELILNNPSFKVLTNTKISGSGSANGDLNEFIKGQLNSISIKEFSISNGKFSRAILKDSFKNRIELEDLDFKMVDFYLGNDSLKRANQFFYGQDASMVIHDGKIFLGDGVHVLTGNTIEVSSFKDELLIKGLKIAPIEDRITEDLNLFRLSLGEFSIDEIDLKRLYNQGVLAAGNAELIEPEIELITYQNAPKGSESPGLADFVTGILDQVTLGSFSVKNGKIQFKDERGQKSNGIGFDQFSFELENLELNPDPTLPFYDQFHAQEIFISLDNYHLKLRDNLHLFQAGNVTLDSKSDLLQIQNLKIHPESQDQIDRILEQTGKTAAVDVFIPLFRAEGIDVQNALFNQNLIVQKVVLPKPNFSISVNQKPLSSKKALQSSDDIRGLLLGYFDQIHVDSILLRQAIIDFESLGQNRRTRFHEDDFYLTLKNFSIHPGDSSVTGKTLFSEEIDLTFNNYLFNLAGGKYFVEMDRMNYNSKNESLTLDSLILRQGPAFSNRIIFGLDFPKVELKGVDIEEFIFDNILDLRKLQVSEGKVSIGIDKLVQNGSDRNGTKKISKTINQIVIDTVAATNSSLEVEFFSKDRAEQSIQTGFEFLIQNFSLDTMSVNRTEIGTLYSSVDVNLENFVFTLPDSVHTLTFSNLSVSDQQDEIVFKNVEVLPRNKIGNKNEPVIEGKFAELGIRTNDLENILKEGVLDFRLLRLSDANLKVFLDEKVAFSPPSEKAKANPKSKLINSLFLRDVNLNNASLAVYRKEGNSLPIFSLPSLDLSLENLDLDLFASSNQFDATLFLSSNPSFKLANYKWFSKDSTIRVDLGKAEFKDGRLSLEDIILRPNSGLFHYLKQKEFQTDVISGTIKKVQADGFDPLSILQNEKINIQALNVEGAKLDIVRDKRLPFDTSSHREMPQILMKNAILAADIGSIHVKDSRIRYFEWGPKSMLPGQISFENLNMDIAPFYLRKSGDTYPIDRLRLGVTTDLMGRSGLKVNSTLKFDKDSSIETEFELDSIDFAFFNDFLTKTQFLKFQEGKISGGYWSFNLNDEYSIGKMTLGYSDLKIEFVDSLTYQSGKGRLRLYSVLANLVLKNGNAGLESPKLNERGIFQIRDKRRFIFNSWWKSTFSGLRGTFGLGRAKIPKEIRKEEENDL